MKTVTFDESMYVLAPREELGALLAVVRESTYGSNLGREGRAKVALQNYSAAIAKIGLCMHLSGGCAMYDRACRRTSDYIDQRAADRAIFLASQEKEKGK